MQWQNAQSNQVTTVQLSSECILAAFPRTLLPPPSLLCRSHQLLCSLRVLGVLLLPCCVLWRVICNFLVYKEKVKLSFRYSDPPLKTVQYLWDQNPPPFTISVMIAFWRYRHLCYTSYLPSSSFCDRSTLYCNYSGLVNKALLLVKSSLFSIFKCPKSIYQCLKCILSKQKYTLSLENARLGE